MGGLFGNATSLWESAFMGLALWCILPSAAQATREQGQPVRPLAQDFVAVGESPDAVRISVYTPSILALPVGRLVASYEFGRGKMTADEKKEPYTHIRLLTTTQDVAGCGTDPRGHLAPVACRGRKTRGNIYLVMEKRAGKEIIAWPGGEYGPVLMRAKETDDLPRPQSWTFSNTFAMIEAIPGYRENKLPFDYFGLPFYRQHVLPMVPPGGANRYAIVAVAGACDAKETLTHPQS